MAVWKAIGLSNGRIPIHREKTGIIVLLHTVSLSMQIRKHMLHGGSGQNLPDGMAIK
jgi:hypothetical protein